MPDPASRAPAAAAVPHPDWSRKRIARGLWIFVVLTIAGFLLAFARGALPGSLRALSHVHPVAIAVGVALAGLDQVLGGARMWLCARALGERVRGTACLQANGGNVFLGGVTPSQTGGGPAQIFLLMHGGLSFASATVVSLCTFLGTSIVFLTIAAHLTLVPPDAPIAPGWRLFTGITLGVFSFFVLLGLLALPRPETVAGRLRATLGRLPGGERLADSGRYAGFERLLHDYSRLMRVSVRRGKLALVGVVVLSFWIYLNKFSIAVVVLRGLGLEVDSRAVLHLQELQYLVMYYAPTPGASGVAELSAAEIMRPVVAPEAMGAYLLLWRVFSLYVGMLFGGFVLLRVAFRRARPAAPGERR